jgi:hypothetical protein
MSVGTGTSQTPARGIPFIPARSTDAQMNRDTENHPSKARERGQAKARERGRTGLQQEGTRISHCCRMAASPCTSSDAGGGGPCTLDTIAGLLSPRPPSARGCLSPATPKVSLWRCSCSSWPAVAMRCVTAPVAFIPCIRTALAAASRSALSLLLPTYSAPPSSLACSWAVADVFPKEPLGAFLDETLPLPALPCWLMHGGVRDEKGGRTRGRCQGRGCREGIGGVVGG